MTRYYALKELKKLRNCWECLSDDLIKALDNAIQLMEKVDDLDVAVENMEKFVETEEGVRVDEYVLLDEIKAYLGE